MLDFIKLAWEKVKHSGILIFAILAVVALVIFVIITMGKMQGAQKVIDSLRQVIQRSIDALGKKNQALRTEDDALALREKELRDKIKNEAPLVAPGKVNSDKELEDRFGKIADKMNKGS